MTKKRPVRAEGVNRRIVRCDVRIPERIYERVEEIAIARGNPLHHITKRPILSPTIVELIEIGLAHYTPPPDTEEKKGERLREEIRRIEDQLEVIKRLL